MAERKREVIIGIRVTAEERDTLDAIAAQEQRTRSDMARILWRKAMEAWKAPR